MASPRQERLREIQRLVNGMEEGTIIVTYEKIFRVEELPSPTPWFSVGRNRRHSDLAVSLYLRHCEDAQKAWCVF